MDKQNVVDYLVHCVDDNMYGWCIEVDLSNLWQDHPKQFLEMKVCMRACLCVCVSSIVTGSLLLTWMTQ